MSDALVPFIDTDPLYEDPIIQSQLGQKVPRLKICYQGSEDKPPEARPGDLFLDTTGEVFDTVEVVLLALVPTYRLLEGKWAPDRVVSCWSADCLVPVGTGINPQPGPCNQRMDDGKIVAACPKKKWDRTNPDRPIPPECGDHYFSALWDLTRERGMVFESKNAGNDAFRYLLNQIRSRGRDLTTDEKIPPRFRCRFHLTVEPKSQYYVPRINIAWDRPVTDDELSKCAPFMDGLREEMARIAQPFIPRDEDSIPF